MGFKNHKLVYSIGLELIFKTPDNTALLVCVPEMSEFGWD